MQDTNRANLFFLFTELYSVKVTLNIKPYQTISILIYPDIFKATKGYMHLQILTLKMNKSEHFYMIKTLLKSKHISTFSLH